MGVLVIISMLAIIVYLRNDQICKRKEKKESDERIEGTDILADGQEEYEINNVPDRRGQFGGVRNRNNNPENRRFFRNRLRGRGRLNLVEDLGENDGPQEDFLQGNNQGRIFQNENNIFEEQQVIPENENEEDYFDHEGELDNVQDTQMTRGERRKRRKEWKEEKRRRAEEKRKKESEKTNENNDNQFEGMGDESDSDSNLERIIQKSENESEEDYLLRMQLRKKKQEYKAWKNMFTFEETGILHENENSFNDDKNMLSSLIKYIKTKKIVKIDELALKYNISSADMIQRLKTLQMNNEIMGIVDDRGKFISLEENELDAIANFIKKKGRISIADLTNECNRLIRLS